MRLLPSILANLLLLLAAFGLGSLLRPLLPQNFSKLDRIATIALGGLGLLGTLLFLVGMLHFSSTVVLAVLLPAALLGLLFLRKEMGHLATHRPFENIPILPVVVIALILFVTFVGGLAEPVGDIKLDAIAYHFLDARVWLRDAVIHVIPDECHASFPATVETLFAALMAVGGTRAPELFAFLAFGVFLLVAGGFAIRLGLDPGGAWWAVALIACMPVVYRGSYGGFNDVILSGCVLVALRVALDADGPWEYALAGVFAGLAMGVKYTGIIAFLLILGCAFLHALGRRVEKPAVFFAGGALFSILAAVVASPWYLRNWLVLGSPIYPPPPLLLRFFHAKYMSADAIQSLNAFIQKEGLGMGHNLSAFLLLPFHLTFHPANFLNGPGGVGVALLALAPFGLWMQRRDLFVRILALFAFLQTVAWFLTEQDARFLIHLYVILAIFAIWGWRYVISTAPRFGPLLSSLAIACSILYGLFMICTFRVDDLHAAVSGKFENQRIAREVPFLDSFAFLNDDPTVKKVLVLAPRFPTFYLRKDYLKPVGRFGEESLPNAGDTKALLQNAAALGISHVIDVRVDENDFKISGKPDTLTLVFEREDQRIYRVSPAP
jgi:hypothetical protein